MPDIANRQQYADYKASVAEFIASEGLSHLSTSTSDIRNPEDENQDTWFSWSPCECCGCALGGSREYLFGRDAVGTIQRFTICTDCVYYIEYGRLDDETMARVEQD